MSATMCNMGRVLVRRIQVLLFAKVHSSASITYDDIMTEVKSVGRFPKLIKKRERKKLQWKAIEDAYLPPDAKLCAQSQSLIDRGFSRENAPYEPPENVEEKLKVICNDIFGKSELDWKQISLDDSYVKYKVLNHCIVEFCHDLPNSLLHKMLTFADVAEYYRTPVVGVLPYDVMIRDRNKLPPNLHVIPDGIRFHPETDTLFGGISAFPDIATIVTGLKAKKKYKGYNPKIPWPKV